MTLGTLASGRDNNFNLIRVLAAFAVLVSHGFALSTGSPANEPLGSTLGVTQGTLAVDVFFAISGFLLAASIEKRPLAEFASARILRIYPALLIVVFITVFVVGPVLSTTPASYFTGRETYRYLLKCSTLFFGVSYELPGVFVNNPVAKAVNGSLWTLPQEVRCYLILVTLWLLSRWTRIRFPILIYGTIAIAAGLMFVSTSKLPPLAFVFFLGSAIYLQRDRIPLSLWVAAPALAAIVLCALIRPSEFKYAFMLLAPYLVIYLAYVPAGFVRLYNRLGDYSYGIYILAYPIQQTIVSESPGISPALLIAYATLPTIMLAILSWHLVEKRALALKGHAILVLSRRLARQSGGQA